MTPDQIRPARELLGWSLDLLTEKSGVTAPTLLLVEAGRTKPRAQTLAAIRNALETAGVEFTGQSGNGPGVRLKG